MKKYAFIMFVLCLPALAFAQKKQTDAHIIGHVACRGEHIPFANVVVQGTTIGTTTDETGHFQLLNLPVGEHTVMVSVLGYKPKIEVVSLKANETKEIKFEIEEDVLQLEEVVVSANRAEQKRTEAPVIVNTISPQIFSTTQSVTLGEGLNFSPGLRLENNCQNCGFTQVRMNGMEGPYSQILINSRPIFSGLAGVYGLELIPANMIEKVEVIRGGGSALFGSNAIAGTINIILKNPTSNQYEVGTSYNSTGIGASGSAGATNDYELNFNTSMVSSDSRSGIALYGFTREREMFDANNDGFSEISPMNNLTLGTRLYHRFGARSKIAVDFFAIREKRDGGNKQDYPLHERDVAEAVEHNMKNAAITYDQFFRESDVLSVYASGQHLKRDSYYGANQSLQDYGFSKDLTLNVGAQYKAVMGISTLVAGVENTSGQLSDKKLGYPDFENADIQNDTIINIPHTENTTVSDQKSNTVGGFAQFDLNLNRFKLAIGARVDHYQVKNEVKTDEDTKKGTVFSPRLSLMYNILPQLQVRLNYSHGYRAPQIFDEDLHIETSGARQVINVNHPDLKQESSHSIMASVDYNGMIGKVFAGLLVEGFYTILQDPFVNSIGEPDEHGVVEYTRVNATSGATVMGLNFELKFRPYKNFMLNSGFTVQDSRFEEPQDFEEKHFFRTPNTYGFATIDWRFFKAFGLSVTANYTGSMLVPYFGPETDDPNGVLRRSSSFFDLGAKLKYTVRLNGAKLQVFAGIKNVLNSYQHDFDIGIDRDPSYIYGPNTPRALYFGIKIGNNLN